MNFFNIQNTVGKHKKQILCAVFVPHSIKQNQKIGPIQFLSQKIGPIQFLSFFFLPQDRNRNQLQEQIAEIKLNSED